MNKAAVFGLSLILIFASAAWGKVGGGDVIFTVSGAASVTFTHDSHVGKIGLKCSDCHYQIFTTVEKHAKATMADMEKGKSCGTCHNGKMAFDVKGNCDKCHKK